MNTFRKIITALLVIPVGMLIYAFGRPNWQVNNSGLEYLYLLIGLPIAVLAFLAWFQPEVITYFFPPQAETTPTTEVKPGGLALGKLQNVWVLALLVVGLLFAGILVGVGLASSVLRANAGPTSAPLATQLAEGLPFPGSTTTPTAEATSEMTSAADGTEAAPFATLDASGGLPLIQETPTTTPGEGNENGNGNGGGLGIGTVSPTSAGGAGRCVAATEDQLDAVYAGMFYINPENEVQTGWAVPSNEADNLWFIAARIYGPEIPNGVTIPAVWALFTAEDGNIDVYSINSVATEYSNADYGQDSTPVTTMQSDGAQAAYDCAMNNN